MIAVICGQKWKSENASVIAHYKGMAETLKKKHAEENPDYVYNPRKSSDKKKRMTARKAAALAVAAAGSVAGPSTHVTAVAAPATQSTLPLATAVGAAPGQANASSVTVASVMDPGSFSEISDDFDTYQPPDLSHTDPVGLLEFENGNLGIELPISDEALGKLLKEHNDFLTAHPTYQEPFDETSMTVNYTDDTIAEIKSLDGLINWDQIESDYYYTFGDNGYDLCSFFEEELNRLTTPSE